MAGMERRVSTPGNNLAHPPLRGSGEVRQFVGLRLAQASFNARGLGRTQTLEDRDGGAEVGRVGSAADLGDTGQLPELVNQRGSAHSPRLPDLAGTTPAVPRQTRACPSPFTVQPCDRRPHEMQRRNIVPSLQLML